MIRPPTPAAASYRILIVEDEFIISETIATYLRSNHHVTGMAISYAEAVQSYGRDKPDLVLLDIRLSGNRSGIDVANFLRDRQPGELPVPFIYLTSQLDQKHLALAKATFPAGYLGKPIQVNSLLAMIEVTMHNHLAKKAEETVQLKTGHTTHLLTLSSILHLQADHVYVLLHLLDPSSSSSSPLVYRGSVREVLDLLARDNFVQTHRSHAVNLDYVTRYDARFVYLGDTAIPVSSTYRDEVILRLTDPQV